MKKKEINGLFISAINTDCGKTWLISKLVPILNFKKFALRQQLIKPIIAIKPVQSGFQTKDEPHSDCSILHKESTLDLSIDDICLYSFKQSIAPNLAAQIEGVQYSIDDLIQFCKKQGHQRFSLVEGAGGLFSPISDDGFNYHLAKALKMPCILIVSDQLGCISPTIAHLIAAQQKGIEILAIIVNQYHKHNLRKTKSELKKWLKINHLRVKVLTICKDAHIDEIKGLAYQIERLVLKNLAH